MLNKLTNIISYTMQYFKLGIVFLLSIYSCLINIQAAELDTYRLSADDKISVIVFNEPELSLDEIRIDLNGSISMPLIGQVRVQGLTTIELEDKLTQLFTDGYLQKPAVTVSIVEYRLFYILGEVNKPGGYNYRQGLTVERAIALAGGFTDRASKKKITVEHENQNSQIVRVKLTEKIKPGDIIKVGESLF